MSSWVEFAQQAPEMAQFGRDRLHGRVSYLGTIRPGGDPRVHPVTPTVGTQLYVFMEPTSPKGKDIQRNGRYTLHCSVENTGGGEGEFYVRGTGMLVNDPQVRAQAVEACSYNPKDRYVLFVLSIEFAFMNRYTDTGPNIQRWRHATP